MNNAGFGLIGEFESLSDVQIRQQMEGAVPIVAPCVELTDFRAVVRPPVVLKYFREAEREYQNFFGVTAVTREAIQVMRGQKTGGVIQQVTSIGSQIGFPALSICTQPD